MLYGIISVKIKNAWYLGEACEYFDLWTWPSSGLVHVLTLAHSVPAVVIGIVLGPIASKFIDSNQWGSATEGQQNAITLVCGRGCHSSAFYPHDATY